MVLLLILLAVSAAAGVLICALSGAFASPWGIAWLALSVLGSFLAAMLLAAAFLFLLCALVDLKKPQMHDSKLYRTVTYLYIDFIILALRLHVHTQGLEKTPKEGRFLLVCNHLNDIDPAIILHCFQKSQLAFVSKYENYDMPIVGKIMHRIMCQPIDRENDRKALQTILECIRLIKEDEVSMAVFPEGYVSKDKKLHPFRPGVFKIAQRTKVPIVVCTLRDTHIALHKALRLKKSDVQLHLVAVIRPEEYEGISTVELAARVHKLMADDLGPDLVLQPEA